MADTGVLPAVDPLAAVRAKLTQPVQTNDPNAINWRVDPAYDATVRNIQTGLANTQSNLDLSEGRIKSDAQKGEQSLIKSRDDTLKALQNKLAAQGIGFSGINIEEQGNIGQKYLEGYDTLKTNTTRGLEDLARDTLGKIQGYNEQLTNAQLERGQRQTDYEQGEALKAAQAAADKTAADQVRDQLAEIKGSLLKQLTPQPSPTGALTLPPPPPPPKPPAMPTLTPPVNRATDSNTVRAIGVDPTDLQKHLALRGFDPGPVDGRIGAKTHAALIRWKQSVGLPANIDFSPEIYQQLISAGIGTQPGSQGSPGQRFLPGPARAVALG